MSKNTGRVSQIIGPVVDVTFDNNEMGLPDIYDSLEINRENGEKTNTRMSTTHRRRHCKSYIYGNY